jgi:hypothetical protein
MQRRNTVNEESPMNPSSHASGRSLLSPDSKQGIVFTSLSLGAFALLLMVERPHWATAWLVASIFTFGVWRLGRSPQR